MSNTKYNRIELAQAAKDAMAASAGVAGGLPRLVERAEARIAEHRAAAAAPAAQPA